ncbi:MAG: stage III sporulation AC/AD family protein [Eubacteriales bacterium]|nr:stage III sporulation AC/AD family protein [Eubacteriales bacterium]
MIKISGIVIIALLLSVLLRNYRSEFSLLVVICASIIIFIMISEDLNTIVVRFSEITEGVTGTKQYINLMLKVLGISLIAQLLSDLCRDSGESALATQTETAAKVIILIISFPLFESVIEIVTGLLK